MKLYLNKNKQAGSYAAETAVIVSSMIVFAFSLADVIEIKLAGLETVIGNAASAITA